MNKSIIFTAILAAGLVAGCASSQKAGVYQTGQVQSKMRVVIATVIDVREVEIEAKSSGVGATAGAAVGGIAGSGNGYGRGSAVGAIAGAVVGGVAGSMAEGALNKKTGVEIVYRPDNSTETLALVQEKDDQNIQAGDRIRIMEGQFNVRAVKMAGAK